MDKEEGINASDGAANSEWKAAVDLCIEYVARRQPNVHSDDIWTALDKLFPGVTTHEHRAMGQRFRDAVKNGLLAKTDTYRPSERPEAHSNPKPVYRSLVYRAAAA